jgi:hypothetical protein
MTTFSFFGLGAGSTSSTGGTTQMNSGGLLTNSVASLGALGKQVTNQGVQGLFSNPAGGDNSGLSLDPLIKAVGNMQNLGNGFSQTSGAGVATLLSNQAGSLVGQAGASLTSDLSQSALEAGGPWAGLAASALGGVATGLVKQGAEKWAFDKGLQLGKGINLKPVQNFLGGTLSKLNWVKDNMGFLLGSPTNGGMQTYLRMLNAPLAKDGYLKYTSTPFIPTMLHHEVVWEPQGNLKPVTAIRSSQNAASRMAFTLDARSSKMTLLMNPERINVSRSQAISDMTSRTGQLINPQGIREMELHVAGKTPVFYTAELPAKGPVAAKNRKTEDGLTHNQKYTVAYSNLMLLYNFFLNNGYMFDDEDAKDEQKDSDPNWVVSRFQDPNPTKWAEPMRRINSMSYVTVEYQKYVWKGYFKNFKIRDTADSPFNLDYEFTFVICHETDVFKIDSLFISDQTTGHVTSGYSSERALAAQVKGDLQGNAQQNANPKHSNIIMSSVMATDDDNTATSALDHTKTLSDVAMGLSLGGFKLNLNVSKDGDGNITGMRFFGQGPGGQAVDIGQRDNTRSLTIVNPGTSPIKYLSTAQQTVATTQAGDTIPAVKSTVAVSPGGTQYTMMQPGTIAKSF